MCNCYTISLYSWRIFFFKKKTNKTSEVNVQMRLDIIYCWINYFNHSCNNEQQSFQFRMTGVTLIGMVWSFAFCVPLENIQIESISVKRAYLLSIEVFMKRFRNFSILKSLENCFKSNSICISLCVQFKIFYFILLSWTKYSEHSCKFCLFSYFWMIKFSDP